MTESNLTEVVTQLAFLRIDFQVHYSVDNFIVEITRDLTNEQLKLLADLGAHTGPHGVMRILGQVDKELRIDEPNA